MTLFPCSIEQPNAREQMCSALLSLSMKNSRGRCFAFLLKYAL